MKLLHATHKKIKVFGEIISHQLCQEQQYIKIIPVLGILAASWPCGIMLFVSELFGSESIGQVYLSLHQYFDEYKDVLDELRKLL